MDKTEKLNVLYDMRKKIILHAIVKKDKYDKFYMGICTAFRIVYPIKYEHINDMLIYIPELDLQKKEPEFPYGAYWWKCNEYGFLCRLRAIRKAKNEIKK